MDAGEHFYDTMKQNTREATRFLFRLLAKIGRLLQRVSGKTTQATANLTRKSVKTVAAKSKTMITKGRVSERRLQQLGDVHTQTFQQSLLPQVEHSLYKAGVPYAIEHTRGDTFTLMFLGKDTDHVTHCVDRAINTTTNHDQSVNKQDQSQQTRAQQPDESKSQNRKTKNVKTKKDMMQRIKTKYEQKLHTHQQAENLQPPVQTPTVGGR